MLSIVFVVSLVSLYRWPSVTGELGAMQGPTKDSYADFVGSATSVSSVTRLSK